MKAQRDGFALWQDFGVLIGRVLIGWLFVESGWRSSWAWMPSSPAW